MQIYDRMTVYPYDHMNSGSYAWSYHHMTIDHMWKWSYDNVRLWSYGPMIVWSWAGNRITIRYQLRVIWTYDHMDMWSYAHTNLWSHDRIFLWTHDYMIAWVLRFDHMIIWSGKLVQTNQVRGLTHTTISPWAKTSTSGYPVSAASEAVEEVVVL